MKNDSVPLLDKAREAVASDRRSKKHFSEETWAAIRTAVLVHGLKQTCQAAGIQEFYTSKRLNRKGLEGGLKKQTGCKPKTSESSQNEAPGFAWFSIPKAQAIGIKIEVLIGSNRVSIEANEGQIDWRQFFQGLSQTGGIRC
jgi:hypothetical protein